MLPLPGEEGLGKRLYMQLLSVRLLRMLLIAVRMALIITLHLLISFFVIVFR